MAGQGPTIDQTNVDQVSTRIGISTIIESSGAMEYSAMAEHQTVVEDIQGPQQSQHAIQSQQTSHSDPAIVDQQPAITEKNTTTTSEQPQPTTNKFQAAIPEQQPSSSQPTTKDKLPLTTSQISSLTHRLEHQRTQSGKPPPTAPLIRPPQLRPTQPILTPRKQNQPNQNSKPPHLNPSYFLAPKPTLASLSGSPNLNTDLPAAKFVCPLPNCGRTYNTPVGLRNHKIVAHPESFERKYTCHVEACGKVYAIAWTLNAHVKKAHPGQEKVFVCDLEAIAGDGEKGTDGEGVNGEGSSSTRREKEKCGKMMESFKAWKTHQRTVHNVWKCGVGTCEWKGHNKHTLGAHRKNEHNLNNPAPAKTKTKEPAPTATKLEEAEPVNSQQPAGTGLRLETIVSTLSEERIESDLSSDHVLAKATEVMVYEDVEKIVQCPAIDCTFRDVTEWGIRRHWIGAHTDFAYPISTPSHATATVAPFQGTYVPPHLRQSHALPAAQGILYNIPIPNGSIQYAPFTQVTADKTGESPQPKAPIPASRSDIKTHGISHNIKKARYATDQTPPQSKNVKPVKRSRIESVARQNERSIVPPGVRQSSNRPKPRRLSRLSMYERSGSEEGSEYSLPAEPLNGGKKLGARAFANLNHAALRGDEEVLPTPRRRLLTRSVTPEPSTTSSAPTSPEILVLRKTAPAKEVDPRYNPDQSDSEMSSGPENLQVPLKTITTSANSENMDGDAIMRFPREMSSPIMSTSNIMKAPRSNYTTRSVDTSDLEDDLVRGRYLGKNRKTEHSKFRPNSLFIHDPTKEAQMSFHTTTETQPMCFLRRAGAQAQQVGKQAGSGSGSGNGDAATVGGDGAALGTGGGGSGQVASGKRKRATCAGPARVKRPYVWRDGGKRAKEASVHAKIQAKKDKGAGNGGDEAGDEAGAAAA